MITRRPFMPTTAAASIVPAVASAKKAVEYDPIPQFVRIKKQFLPGQLLVAPRSFYLYYVTEPRKAIRYGCGLEFSGTATIDVKKEWPTWRPTDEMIDRDPVTYAKFKDNDYVQPGGGDNPLGARALYLFQNGVDTYFRIHGTTQPQTIGHAVSNGCIRMLNEHVIDLYARVPVGTVVTVV